MKKRLKEMEEEAAALREMQAKVEKEMGAVPGFYSCQSPELSNSQFPVLTFAEDISFRFVF